MRILLAALGAGLILGLSGCGFAPLYAESNRAQALRHIDVTVPDSRTGYFLEQELRQSLNSDLTAPTAYELDIKLVENHYRVGYRADETAARSEMSEQVTYVLRDKATGKVVLSKSYTETASYNASDSPYADVVSQQDAQKRIANSVAQQIATDLTLYFQKPQQ